MQLGILFSVEFIIFYTDDIAIKVFPCWNIAIVTFIWCNASNCGLCSTY